MDQPPPLIPLIPPGDLAAFNMDDSAMSNQDADVCRVCRVEAEPDNPLYYPCKCSGSIRYVHSECLLQWLGHSHKKSCELCGHPFSFKKVYPTNMPTSLPPFSLARKFAFSALIHALMGVRAVVVAVTWLAVLPFVIIWVWRGLFAGGTTAAWYLSGRNATSLLPPAPSNSSSTILSASDFNHIVANVGLASIPNGTLVDGDGAGGEGTRLVLTRSLGRIVWEGVGRPRESIGSIGEWVTSLYHDKDLPNTIFKGQILTVSIIVLFLAIFLLREWIFQNLPIVEAARLAPAAPAPAPEDWDPALAVKWRRMRPKTRPKPLNPEERARLQRLVAQALEARERGEQVPGMQRMVELALEGRDNGEMLPGLPRARRAQRGREERRDVDLVDPPGLLADVEHAEFVRRMTPAGSVEAIPPPPPVHPREPPPQPAPGMLGRLDVDDLMYDLDVMDGIAPSGDDWMPQPSGPTLEEMRNARSRRFDGGAGQGAEAGPSNPGPSNTGNRFEHLDMDQMDGLKVPEREHRPRRRSPRLHDPDRAQSDGDDETEGQPWGAVPPNGSRDGSPPWKDVRDREPTPYYPDRHRNRRADSAPLPDRGNGNGMDPDQHDEIEDDWVDEPLENVPEEQAGAEADDEVVENGPEPDEFDEFDDEFEGEGFILEGDLEGILEAVGMRGPPYVLLQNFLLIVVVLASCLSVFVEIPYVIGKIHLLADTTFTLHLVKLPVRLVRIATDPIVDFVIKISTDFIIRPIWNSLSPAGQSVVDSKLVQNPLVTGLWQLLLRIAGGSAKVGAESAAEKVQHAGMMERLGGLLSGVVAFVVRSFAKLGLASMPSPSTTIAETSVEGAESTVTWLSAQALQASKQRVAEFGFRDSISTRVAAVALGYADSLLVAVVLAAIGEKNMGEFGKIVIGTLNHYHVMLKLGFFMGIELIVFPFGMGCFLDLCSLPLFVNASISSRMETQRLHPILSLFAHWLAGTLFMFAFARFLSICRSVCRKGAMYVIRDPQDPSFSPVRDILDKSSTTQLWKLFISACMYLSVLAGPMGGMLLVLKYQTIVPELLPLRWHIQEPISQTPFDLLFVLFTAPYHLTLINPAMFFRMCLKYYWTIVSRHLRLSSYFYGIRFPQQETPGSVEKVLLNIASVVIKAVYPQRRAEDLLNGSFMRVPYADQVALVRPRKQVFVPVTEDGIPKTDEGRIVSLLQARAARLKGRDPAKDYCMVYLPPLFKLRFWLFGVCLWTVMSWSMAAAFFIPLMIGRGTLLGLFHKQVHDGYSYIVGMYIFVLAALFAFFVGKRVTNFVKKFTRAGHYRNPVTLKSRVSAISRVFVHQARVAYSMVMVIGVIPIFIALTVELYVLQPLKYGMSGMTPVFYVQEAWSIGMCILAICYIRHSILCRIVHLIDPEDIGHDHQVWARDAVQPRNVNQKIVFPVVRILGPLCVGPTSIILVTMRFFKFTSHEAALAFRYIHPLLLSLYLLSHLLRSLHRRLKRWSHKALEEEYLVEKRVTNYDGKGKGGREEVVYDDPAAAAAVAAQVQRDRAW